MNEEARNRYVAAKGYVEACKMILMSPLNEARVILTILPTHMLAAFSIELFLKAWLLEVGRSSDAVRALRHDLTALYAEAAQAGLPTSADLDAAVAMFSAPHGDFTYRYLERDTRVDIANWPVVIPALDALDNAVDTRLGASASKGLAPGH